MSISTHDPDVLKVPHRVHKKYRTVSVSRIFTPDQHKKINKIYTNWANGDNDIEEQL